MATFDFRILLNTVEGKQLSYVKKPFINTDTASGGIGLVLSASDAWHRITGSISC